MPDLFDQNLSHDQPLAEIVRPKDFLGFVGQDHLIAEGAILRQAIETDNLPSMILWGPPGCGKTTLARIIAGKTKATFVQLSAVSGGVAQVKELIDQARERKKFHRQKTILFVDEIHRFNKSQQAAFLPYIEDGTIIFIGATTENPSFEVISPLLSRAKVFVLNSLSNEDVEKIIRQAVKSYPEKVEASPEIVAYLAAMVSGDGRAALNALELAIKTTKTDKNGIIILHLETIKEALQRSHLLYDKTGEEHYDLISALHKSLRGSDANAAIYWLARMLESGEDPLYVARRLVRFASEDIGLAEPEALTQAVAAFKACQMIGLPECNVNLAQAVVFMAKAPKSNKLYTAYQKAQKDIKELPGYPVPLHLRNAPTKLMKNLGYGKDYKYNPAFEGTVEQDYLPEGLKDRKYLD